MLSWAKTVLPLLLVFALWPAQAMAQFVLSIDDVSMSEGDVGLTSVFFDVRLDSPAPPGGIAFEFATSDGSADSADYDGTSLNRGRIQEGSRQTRIDIGVYGDYDIESNETFFVNLLNPVGATIGDAQAVATILDDDTAPRRISVDDAVAAEGDALHFSIMLDKAARLGGVSFDVTISDGTATGGVDYQALPTTRIAIPQGERQADIFIEALADDIAEGEESLRLDIGNVTGAEPGAVEASGTITDIVVSRPSINIENTQIIEGNSGITPMAYRVTLSEQAVQTVSVDYRSSPEGDIPAATGRLIFRPGETVKFATVPVVGDTRVESNAVIHVELFNAVNADLGNSDASGIVFDDDTDLALSPTSLPDGRFGERYDQILMASGGVAPYTMAITAGVLPPGMRLVLSNGRYYVVDTPSTVGTYHFTVTVTDSAADPVGPFSIHRDYTIRVNAPPTLILQSSPDTLLGNEFQPFSARIHAAGGFAPYQFAVIGGRLPNGIALDSDGTLSGTPTESGPFFFTVSAIDHVPGVPQTASRDFSIFIARAPVSLTPLTLPTGYLNESYSKPLTALGGLPPYAFNLSAGTLPPGLQLLANGAVHGTPTVAGQYRFSVTVNDNAQPMGSEATVAYVVDIMQRPLQVNALALVPIQAGTAFSTFFSAQGGTGPYTFALAAGALPRGLSLSSTGVLQGTPDAIGSFDFDIRVTDSVGATASLAFRLDVVLPIVTLSAAMPNGQVGNPFSQSVYANGGLQPHTFSITAGALPPGLELDPRGIVLGVPEAAGSYTFTLTAADSSAFPEPATGNRTYTVRIDPSGFVFGPDTLPNARIVQLYEQRFNVLYGTPPYRYTVSAGELPPGLFLFSGMLYGVPSQPGSYTFSITGSDSHPQSPSSYTRDYTLLVEYLPVEINPQVFPVLTAGSFYNSQVLTSEGGLKPYRYSLAAGALPPGISLSEDGYVSGTPTEPGQFTFTAQVTDSAGGSGSTATREFSITVVLPEISIDTERLQPAAVGSNFLTIIRAVGGSTPYTYALTAGTLPAGLQLTANGYLLGIPEVTGSFEITITATDSSTPFGPISASRSYTLVVEPRRLEVYPNVIPDAFANIPYSVKLQGRNGVAPYHFSVTNGTLPPGLSLNTDGTISGIPGPPPLGSPLLYQYRFALSIVDSNGVSATFPYLGITLRGPSSNILPSISPATVSAGTAGVTNYQQQFTAVDATAPFALIWESGTLPNGLRFDPATATLSGIPLESGQFQFRLQLTDAENRVVVNDYVLQIAAPTLTLTPNALPDGVAGTAYRHTFVATGGIAPYRYTVIERGLDRLPPGLSFSDDGLLQGTPTDAGEFAFDIVAADSTSGQSASIRRRYTMTIAAPAIAIETDTLAKASHGLDYVQTLTARGGTSPYTFSITAGALPPGLVLTAAGELSGTPAEVGESSFTVTATDARGFTGTRAYTIAVTVLKPIPASRVYAVAAGDALTVDLTEGASGGPFTAAALVSLSPSDAGTAKIVTTGGVYRLEFMARHAFSGRATATFTLSNASTTSTPTMILFDVAPRPDPSSDAELKRLLDAQAQAAQRFAGAQIGNFQQRMERMHGAGEDPGFSNGLSAMVQDDCPQPVGSIPGRRCVRRAGETGAKVSRQVQSQDDNAAFGLWASGMIRSGNHDGRNRDPDIDFETDGISVGADYRLNDAFAFGGGLGYGRDESDIGENGSRSKSEAFTFALYASYSPGASGFVDVLLGYQSLNYDLRRRVETRGNAMNGSRDGRQWFGSLATGADIQRGHWQFTPYARLDLARATLDSYAETGDARYALAYGDLDIETTTGNAGLRIDYRREVDWGTFSPQFRLEYQHDFENSGAQTIQYADLLPGPMYRTELNDFDRNRFVIGLGALFNTDSDWTFRIEYRSQVGGDDSDHGLLLNVEKKY